MTSAPPWIWPRAVYLHVPFCQHHCGYCDFAIATGHDDLRDAYVDALITEMSTLGSPQQVETLFIGGGTPTHLTAEQLARLLGAVRRWLEPQPGYEWTVEANPESLTDEKVAILADHGVTRVSLGAQSFSTANLAVLDRIHDPREVALAVARARKRLKQVSLDLIFGVPGQTKDSWRTDLERGLSLESDHLSTYGLTYEKGTPLWKQRRRGLLLPLDEDTELALYDLAIDLLTAAGFEHYEVSNFARPGARCRHNEVYWANEAYFGFGMGAARYVERRRELNTRDLRTYLQRVQGGEAPTFQSEMLPPEERARETIAVQLRRGEGIQRARFRSQTGFELDDLVRSEVRRLEDLGLLVDDGQSVRLTRRGRHVADGVIERLL